MPEQLQPIGGNILVRPIEENHTLPSGLVIPDTAQDKPVRGTVIAAGDGAYENGQLVPMPVSVGDTIMYSKYHVTEITFDGEDLLILGHRDVTAKVVDEVPNSQ